jgi:hypothetical protein
MHHVGDIDWMSVLDKRSSAKGSIDLNFWTLNVLWAIACLDLDVGCQPRRELKRWEIRKVMCGFTAIFGAVAPSL